MEPAEILIKGIKPGNSIKGVEPGNINQRDRVWEQNKSNKTRVY